MTTMTSPAPGARPVGELLREWRERRRLSQLDLAIQADISARHLSFVETGRSRPTPTMIMRLTEQLSVPLRERNTLLLAPEVTRPPTRSMAWTSRSSRASAPPCARCWPGTTRIRPSS
jgi:transcriptional regulator with XRE-family HTH domain